MTKPVQVIGFREMKNAEGKIIINTTSKSTNWSKGLSPFYLGSVELYGGHVAKNVENAWQFSKVYPEYADEEQNPTDEYFKWAKEGWTDSYAHRYPMGKGKIPLYSYWEGHKLTYIEARRAIYAPIYAKAVVNTPAFEQLLDLYESGEDFVPIYWMATEDHDFEEIHYFNYEDKKFQWNKNASGPVGRLDLEDLDKVFEAF